MVERYDSKGFPVGWSVVLICPFSPIRRGSIASEKGKERKTQPSSRVTAWNSHCVILFNLMVCPPTFPSICRLNTTIMGRKRREVKHDSLRVTAYSFILSVFSHPGNPRPLAVMPPIHANHPKISHLTRDQRRDCQLLRSIGWQYAVIQVFSVSDSICLYNSGYPSEKIRLSPTPHSSSN